jgi:predicted outer membrane repeat protein
LPFSSRQGYYGGVINLSQGKMTMTRTHFINNTAMVGGQGGTIYTLDLLDANFTDCSWVNNSAYEGAGIYASQYGGAAQWTFNRCNFTGNIADEKGAAIYTSGMNYTFKDTIFEGNKALLGAGIYATTTGTERPLYMDFDNCTATDNSAEQSAGVAWLYGYKKVTLSKSVVSGNRAGQAAGGLYLKDTPARLTSCVLQGNSARMGAAVTLHGGDSALQAIESRFVSNKVCLQRTGVMPRPSTQPDTVLSPACRQPPLNNSFLTHCHCCLFAACAGL